MHRLHIITANVGGPMPPQGDRDAVTQKAVKEATSRKGQEEAHRMGDALAYAKKKETLSIK